MNGQAPHSWKIDPHKASVARVYDYLLGGKDDFAIDRQMGDKILAGAPDVYLTAKLNKDFGARVTRYTAQHGIRQFIDLGSGIPTTPPSVHETARGIAEDVKVAYVDYDPIVVAHSNALRDIGPGVTTILADIRQPDTILSHPELLKHIDFSWPVTVLIMSVMQTVVATPDAHDVLRTVRDRLAPGSFLGLSHISSTWSTPAALDKLIKSAEESGYPPLSARTDTEILGFFDGFDVAEPGLVDLKDWRTDTRDPAVDDLALKLSGALGRKP